MAETHRSGSRRRWGVWIWPLVAILWCHGLAAPGATADEATSGWQLGALRAEEIWQHTRGEGVTVAVIDSGVDNSIPELRGQVLEGADVTRSPEGANVDEHGHGTDMASLIAGTGAEGGVQGLAPGANVLPVRVQQTQSDLDFQHEERWAEAVSYAVEAGAQVISISLSMPDLGFASDQLDAAIAEAVRHDVLIFASTGNSGGEDNRSTFPSNQEGVVGVAAVDPDGEHATYSTYGPQVAIAAPGTDIPLRCGIGSSEMCLGYGTSNATAIASASAALIWSAHPDWTKNQVLRAVIDTASGGGQRDQYVGYGMIQPARVIVDGEGEPGDPDVNPLFEAYEASLDPPATPEPQPVEDEPTHGSGEEQEAEPVEAPTESGGSQALWLVIGGGGLAIGAAVVAWVVWNRRRQRLGTVYVGTASPPGER
ncbi:S8 family serine peptidase [Streptomyces sp. 8K308]|uniref:S8 family serine peptidase n=1 Tax=Streptomyces sp. 8K308 TaxID=2530388 RepID=UPI001404BE58|nr:S8 family serine peptidase [Streptomyces sp. 8K308]